MIQGPHFENHGTKATKGVPGDIPSQKLKQPGDNQKEHLTRCYVVKAPIPSTPTDSQYRLKKTNHIG